MFDRYCKASRPEDGAIVTVRHVARADLDETFAFVGALPKEDHVFPRQDVSDPGLVHRRTKRDKARTAPLPIHHPNGLIAQRFARCVPLEQIKQVDARHGW